MPKGRTAGSTSFIGIKAGSLCELIGKIQALQPDTVIKVSRIQFEKMFGGIGLNLLGMETIDSAKLLELTKPKEEEVKPEFQVIPKEELEKTV